MTTRHESAILTLIRKRLQATEKALKDLHMPEVDRADVLFSGALSLWTWYGMHRRVGFSCSEWFDLTFPRVAPHANPLNETDNLMRELGVS